LNLGRHAAKRVFESDFEIVADIFAALRPVAFPPTPARSE